MSGLTPCNHCTLERIKRDEVRSAVPRPVTIKPVRMPGDHEHWLGVYVGDGMQPSAYFRELTAHCVC